MFPLQKKNYYGGGGGGGGLDIISCSHLINNLGVGGLGLGGLIPSIGQVGGDSSTTTLTTSSASTTTTTNLQQSSTTSACKSHKEAERRRRQRINAHLSTLRTLLPNTTKTDKASLLAEVVNHVKDLKRQAADVARQDYGQGFCNTTSGGGGELSETEPWPFPAELDEATLSYCGDSKLLMKATVCCDDRPGLNRDFTQAIKSVRAKAIRAEMMTLGGRTKSVVVMKWASGAGPARDEEVVALKRALKAVVENRAAHVFPCGKRSRVI